MSPSGDLAAARTARSVCDDPGLTIASYGSYLAAGRIADARRGPLGARDRGRADSAQRQGLGAWTRSGCRPRSDLRRGRDPRPSRSRSSSTPGTATETAAATNVLLERRSRPGTCGPTGNPTRPTSRRRSLAELAAVAAPRRPTSTCSRGRPTTPGHRCVRGTACGPPCSHTPPARRRRWPRGSPSSNSCATTTQTSSGPTPQRCSAGSMNWTEPAERGAASTTQPGRQLDHRRLDAGAAGQPCSSVKESDATSTPSCACCGDEQLGLDVSDHQLGPAEHGEGAVCTDVAPREVEESLALLAVHGWPARSTPSSATNGPHVDLPARALSASPRTRPTGVLADLNGDVHVVQRYGRPRRTRRPVDRVPR